MAYSSATARCAERPSIGSAHVGTKGSRGLRKKVRPASHSSADRPFSTLIPARQEDHVWEAIQKMILASRPRFLRIAYAIVGNSEDAEDAVQDASLSAYVHSRTFEGRSALKTWFTRIVMNAALIIRRKRKNGLIHDVPESCIGDDTPWTERIPTSQPDPEMRFAKDEAFHLIDFVVEEMRPALRQAFQMFYYDEMSVEEAIALLGVKSGTFKSRVSRAKKHLLNQLERTLVVPIRRRALSSVSPGKNGFQALTAGRSEISSREIALFCATEPPRFSVFRCDKCQ